MTKQELIEENGELREALEEIREQIDEALGEDTDGDDE